jgi:uncharacterized membrane protein YfcA
MIIDIIAGLLFGILAGMGVGGGGLLVIYLTLFDGIGQRAAQGVNLFFFIFASAASMLYHINKRKINFPFVALCSISGCIFALLGSYAAAAVDPHILKMFFGAMLIIAGLLTLWKICFGEKR